MSTLTPDAPPRVNSLATGALPRWAPVALFTFAVLVSLTLLAATSAHGVVQLVVLTLLVFLVSQTGLSFGVEGPRRAKDRLAGTLMYTAFGIALVPLVSVITLVVSKGAPRFDSDFFGKSQNGITARDAGGGAYHAIIGTLEQVAIASAIAIPLGVLIAVYLVEYGRGRRFARVIAYTIDVMTGLPSIVAGLFILALWIIALGQGFSGFAGALALAILQLPVVVRASEEMLRLVPDSLREASFALGVPRWRTITKIVIPTALPGMITGIMLSIARVTGETAPIVLLTFGTNSINLNPFSGAQSSLPLFVFQQASQPNNTAVARAWTGALTLIIIVMLLNLVARVVARYSGARR